MGLYRPTLLRHTTRKLLYCLLARLEDDELFDEVIFHNGRHCRQLQQTFSRLGFDTGRVEVSQTITTFTGEYTIGDLVSFASPGACRTDLHRILTFARCPQAPDSLLHNAVIVETLTITAAGTYITTGVNSVKPSQQLRIKLPYINFAMGIRPIFPRV